MKVLWESFSGGVASEEFFGAEVRLTAGESEMKARDFRGWRGALRGREGDGELFMM